MQIVAIVTITLICLVSTVFLLFVICRMERMKIQDTEIERWYDLCATFGSDVSLKQQSVLWSSALLSSHPFTWPHRMSEKRQKVEDTIGPILTKRRLHSCHGVLLSCCCWCCCYFFGLSRSLLISAHQILSEPTHKRRTTPTQLDGTRVSTRSSTVNITKWSNIEPFYF